MFPPPESAGDTWVIEPLDPLINAKLSTAQWAKDHIPSKSTRKTPVESIEGTHQEELV